MTLYSVRADWWLPKDTQLWWVYLYVPVYAGTTGQVGRPCAAASCSAQKARTCCSQSTKVCILYCSSRQIGWSGIWRSALGKLIDLFTWGTLVECHYNFLNYALAVPIQSFHVCQLYCIYPSIWQPSITVFVLSEIPIQNMPNFVHCYRLTRNFSDDK